VRGTLLGRQDISLGTGYSPVDTAVSCVLTRFNVRSLWSLIRFYLAYRAIKYEAQSIPGLLVTAFLIEGPRTCCTLSIFSNPEAIGDFNVKIRSHITAANASFRHLRFASGRPQLWSAQFHLAAISSKNFRWGSQTVDASLADALKANAR
jgi:hypothetical protein